ncbi:hypothetical protein LINPERHAP1_LOCUS23174 [Linum perenne]
MTGSRLTRMALSFMRTVLQQ